MLLSCAPNIHRVTGLVCKNKLTRVQNKMCILQKYSTNTILYHGILNIVCF